MIHALQNKFKRVQRSRSTILHVRCDIWDGFKPHCASQGIYHVDAYLPRKQKGSVGKSLLVLFGCEGGAVVADYAGGLQPREIGIAGRRFDNIIAWSGIMSQSIHFD